MMERLTIDLTLPLDRFDLRVELETTHRVTGLFGVSGSGKTSLLETIAGLRRHARGRLGFGEAVWIDSARGLFVPPERRDIGYLPQEALLFPHLSVRENLNVGSRRAERRGGDTTATFDAVVGVLEIGPLLHRHPKTLSGGERQRVALGRALCSGPRFLLLDEPLSALDAALRRSVLPFLRRVQEEFRLPMLVVSHNPVEVQALCDDMFVLRDGAVIARGAPRSILTRPDVLPLSPGESFENILPARLMVVGSEVSEIEIGSGVRLIVPRPHASSGAEILLGIPAGDVLIATEPLRGLSARNILAGRIASITDAGNHHLVAGMVADDAPPLIAEVTADAVAELGLHEGMRVWFVVKTSSVVVYA